MTKLIYCATPGRISHKKKEIMDFVTKQNYAPFHPFQAFELERFENGLVGRKKTIEFCKRAVEICDEFWVFGVSEGTLEELAHAIKHEKPIKLFLGKFDSEWKKYYEKIGAKYGKPLDNMVEEKS